jgi:hypothetical protein
MIVEIETPEGLMRGSAVREIKTEYYDGLFKNIFPLEGGTGHTSLKGEAVVVNLPGNKYIFALLCSDIGNLDYAKKIPRDYIYSSDSQIELWPSRPTILQSNRIGEIPLLVTFGDINNPRTIETVRPNRITNEIGKGSYLKRITVQYSEEPVTNKIDKTLKWINHLDRYRSDPENPFSNYLPSQIWSIKVNQQAYR